MLVVTDAIVLHAFDYLETSRILRLITREAGIQSVIAKGARRSRARFGSAVDLFAEGEAQLYIKPTRELHTLGAFDVSHSREALGHDMERFMAGSAIAELTLRCGRDDTNPELYQTLRDTLDQLVLTPHDQVIAQALAGAWRIVSASGFTPSLDSCASCHAPLDPTETVVFSHPAGGALCGRCARMAPPYRPLPADARTTLRLWLRGDPAPLVLGGAARAHQRLLREFLYQHLADERPLRAFTVWESNLMGTPHPASA